MNSIGHTHTRPRLHSTATQHGLAQGCSGKVHGTSWTPRAPLPTPVQGGVTTDGFNLIRGHGAMRELLGIILGNPASWHGLNTSRASQNQVFGGSWVTQAVTQGCATRKPTHSIPSPARQNVSEGSGEGMSLPTPHVAREFLPKAAENAATANPPKQPIKE